MTNIYSTETEDSFAIHIPKSFLQEQFIQRFLERLRFLELVQQSELTADVAWQLSEEIKSSWWVENKERILNKLNEV